MVVRLLVFLLLLTSLFQCAQKTAADYYKAGLDAYRQTKYAAAIEDFQSVIRLDAKYQAAYLKLYASFKESGRQHSAEMYFKRLTAGHPNNSFPVYFLGRAYQLGGNSVQAQRAFKNAIRLKPVFAEVYSALAESAKECDNADSVEIFFKRLLSEQPEKEAYAHFGLAFVEMMRMHWESSLSELDKALGVKADFPAALALKAKDLRYLGRYQQAIAAADLALGLQSVRNNADLKSDFLISKAGNFWYLGDNTSALTNLKEALALSRQNVNVFNELQCLNILGLIYRETNQNKKALTQFQSALQLIEKRGYTKRQGVILANIGDVHLTLAQYDSALYYYSKALNVLKANADIRNLAATLGSMAAVYAMQGDYNKAERLGKEAIGKYKQLGDKSGQSTEIVNLAANYVEKADYVKALNALNQALPLIREIKEKYLEQVCFGLFGATYLALGNYRQAGVYFKKALNIAEKIGSQSDVAVNWGHLATLSLFRGDTTLALKDFGRALATLETIGDRRNAAISCNNIGNIYIRQKEYQKASSFLRRARKIQLEIGDKFNLARTLNNLANLHYQQKEYAQAVALHRRAFSLADSLQAAETAAAAAYGLGRTYYAQDRPAESLLYFKKAVAAVENMRGEIKKSELKENFLENKTAIYKGIIDVYYTMFRKSGKPFYADSALFYAEKGRARTLFDLLATIRKNQKNKKPPIPQPHSISPAEIQKSAQRDSALIVEYAFAGNNCYLWAVSADRIYFFKLNHGNNLRSTVNEYLKVLSSPPQTGRSLNEEGKQLFRQLFGPIETVLTHHKKIVIIPDDLLHYLPFEALVSADSAGGTYYLVERHQISYAPSAAIFNLLLNRETSAQKQAAFVAFADPLFHGKTRSYSQAKTETMLITQRGFDLSPLPYSGEEVKTIARLFPAGQARLFLNGQASEKNVKRANLQGYRRVHFATHVLIDENLPARSCIALSSPADSSEDGFLRLDEIFALHLNADLVTLSGCQSAKGKLTRAEGVMGLTRAFFYAGARSLLVSQWPVNDYTTAHFMEIFYRHLQEGGSKSAALQQTKIEFIRGAPARNRHPYYWAPFILTGCND